MDIIQKYNQHNSLRKDDVKCVLQTYGDMINWYEGGNDMVLDIGCGSGETTEKILLPSLPENFKSLFAVDIATKIIEVKKTENQNPKLVYEVMDIGNKEINEKLIGKFDHIFSFYCLNWVENKRQAFQNIYNLLKPKGDILIHTLVENPFTLILEVIKGEKKLKENLPNVPEFESNLKTILSDVGFAVRLLEVSVLQKRYSINDFEGLLSALEYIPDALDIQYPDNYLREMIRIGSKMRFWKITITNEIIVTVHKVIIKANKI